MKHHSPLFLSSLLLILRDGNAFSSQSHARKQSHNSAAPAKSDQKSSLSLSSSSSASPSPSSVSSFSHQGGELQSNQETTSISRRDWTQEVLIGGSLTALFGGSTAEPASAACLPGDLSKSCIGVYKVPIDEGILPYVGTEEALNTYAPDIKYIPPIKPPPNAKTALERLENQREIADDIKQVVLAGKLEEAGIKVLSLLPVINSSGKFIVERIELVLLNSNPNSSTIDDLKVSKLTDDLNLALGLWGECDIVIGQGLRGQLGVTTVAQLQILASLKDASCAYDDFLANAKLLSKEIKLA